MSAPTTHDPLVVNTKDGVVWLRRAVTRDGHGLYAVTDSCKCPPYLMATLAELAEHGIAGSADVLPVSVGPEPQASERDRLRAAFVEALGNAHLTHPCPVTGRLYWTGCVHYDEAGHVAGVGSCHQERRADAVLTVRDAEVEFLVGEVDRKSAQVAELLAERHTTNEALDDAVQALRERQGEREALVERMRAGQRWQRGRNPELVSENLVSQSELRSIFGIPLAAPWADGITQRFAPTQALREDDEFHLRHDYRVPRDMPDLGGAS